MSYTDNRDFQKRLSYIQEQLDLVDNALSSLPILFSNVGNQETATKYEEVTAQFSRDLRKLYSDLSAFHDI